VEYLQADKTTWTGVSYSFPGNIIGARPLPEDTWRDIKFDSLFDEYGQWEFYVTTRTSAGTHVYDTSVLVDKLVALSTLETTIEDPTGIFFSQDGRLVVDDGTAFHHVAMYAHKYMTNGRTQELFLREEYSSVGVVI
jgi:hypothetical protein